MKTIDVSTDTSAVAELLALAGEENILLRAPDGREFVLAEVDDFDREVALVRQNKELMDLLATRSQETKRFTLKEVREKLSLPPKENGSHGPISRIDTPAPLAYSPLDVNTELFNELLASVREGGAILRGEAAPSRAFVIEPPDVRQIRAGYQLSQREFATLLGISVTTLRNWEQGRRSPEGPARVLLQIVARHPDAIWDTVHPSTERDLAKPRDQR